METDFFLGTLHVFVPSKKTDNKTDYQSQIFLGTTLFYCEKLLHVSALRNAHFRYKYQKYKRRKLFVYRNITGYKNWNLSLALSNSRFLCMSAETELEVKFSEIY